MGVRNHHYRRGTEIVTAHRLVRHAIGTANIVANVRHTGGANNSKFVVSTQNGDVEAAPGDWVIRHAGGTITTAPHDVFASQYVPAEGAPELVM